MSVSGFSYMVKTLHTRPHARGSCTPTLSDGRLHLVPAVGGAVFLLLIVYCGQNFLKILFLATRRQLIRRRLSSTKTSKRVRREVTAGLPEVRGEQSIHNVAGVITGSQGTS